MTPDLEAGRAQAVLAEEVAAARQNFALTALLEDVLANKRRILIPAIVLAVLMALYSLRMKPYYAATAIVVPPSLRSTPSTSLLSGLSGFSDNTFASFSNVLQSRAQADSFGVLLQTWPVQDSVIQQLHLIDVFHAKNMEAARRILHASTSYNFDKGFASITVAGSSPQLAADLANAYVDAARSSIRAMSLTEASERHLFYGSQLSKAKDELAAAEAAFKQTEQSSNMVSLDSQARTALGASETLRSRITAREVELQRLRTYLTDSNGEVQIAQSELNALRGQLAQSESQGSGGFTGTGLKNVPANELQFVRASRELRYRESLYDILLKQFEASQLDEARDAPVVQVIESALPPTHKAGPHRVYFVLGALLLGAFLGLVNVVYRLWRRSLPSETQGRMLALRRAAFRW